jgi:hypothetical protein
VATCAPSCEGKECGEDGCGCSCGGCSDGLMCSDGKCILPAEAHPVLTLVPGEAPACNAPFAVALAVQGWDPAAPEAGGECRLDGMLVGSTSGEQFDLPAGVPAGLHSLCCTLTWAGVALAQCEATDCLDVKVACPCLGSGDPNCNDGNPCSLDTCAYLGGGEWECSYGKAMDACCCVSKFDCGCDSGQWAQCDEDASTCAACGQ